MSDPTASFVLTARDATAAAIASADKSLKGLLGTVRSARTLFAGFGVAFGGRVFANWIEGAITANDLTAEQTIRLGDAKGALEAYKAASQDLAVSFAEELTPAIQAASAVMIGWNRILFNADPFPFEKQIRDLEDSIRGVETEAIATAREYGDVQVKFTQQQTAAIEEFKRQIEDLKNKQAEAMEAKGRALHDAPFLKAAQDSMNAFFEKNGKLEVVLTPSVELAPIPSEDELALQKQMQDFIDHAGLPELKFPEIELEPIVDFKPLKEQIDETGKTLGRGLHNSLVDFIVDGQARFKDFIKQMAAEWFVSDVFNSLSTAFDGSGGFFAGLFGGARADGGPVSSGKTYLVGERGPEWFKPGTSGSIIPAGAGGVGDVHVQIDQHFSTDLSPDQAMTMGRVVANSVYEAVMNRLGNRR